MKPDVAFNYGHEVAAEMFSNKGVKSGEKGYSIFFHRSFVRYLFRGSYLDRESQLAHLLGLGWGLEVVNLTEGRVIGQIRLPRTLYMLRGGDIRFYFKWKPSRKYHHHLIAFRVWYSKTRSIQTQPVRFIHVGKEMERLEREKEAEEHARRVEEEMKREIQQKLPCETVPPHPLTIHQPIAQCYDTNDILRFLGGLMTTLSQGHYVGTPQTQSDPKGEACNPLLPK